MTIKQFAATGLAGTALVAMAAAPALACHKPAPKPAPKPVEHKVSVCRPTGSGSNPYVFISIDEHAVTQSDIKAKSAADCPKPSAPAPKPAPLPKPAPQVLSATTQPTVLPQTGAAAGLSALIGLPAMTVAARGYLRAKLGR